MNARRRDLWELYCWHLANIEGVKVPFAERYEPGMRVSQPYIFPILLTFGQDREAVRERLAHQGIQTSVHYPPVHLFRIYQDQFGYQAGDLPVTEDVASNIITLPFYSHMTESDVSAVVEGLKRAL